MPPPLPDIPGLLDANDPDGESLIGIFITHAHKDHWGLVPFVREDIPVHTGAAGERIVKEAAFWMGGNPLRVDRYLTNIEPLRIGSAFTITPYLVDHSAFDAYALLVEADDQRLFYTGDLRAHGRKADLFDAFIRDAPVNIDTLLMEGTHIGADGEETIHGVTSEDELEAQMIQQFRSTPGLALVMTSPQNIDRLVTIYRATLKSDRDLIMDGYSDGIALATEHDRIPNHTWKRVRPWLHPWQQSRIKRTGAFDRVEAIEDSRIFEDEIAASPDRFVMLFSMSSAGRLSAAGALEGATMTYSLWSGYLADSGGEKVRAWLDAEGIPLRHLHSSGHASLTALQRLAKEMDPMQLVPIHTEGAEFYEQHFQDVVVHPDGEWWEV